MEVHIHPPDPTDPGQLVLLWQRVNALVDLVIPIARPDIELVPKGSWRPREPPAHWRANRGLFYEMGGLQESIKPLYTYRPDKDIVMLPFLRLELWDEDPATNVPAMSNEQFDSLYRRLMGLFTQTGIELRLGKLYTMTQDTAARRIKDALIETHLFIETSLDEMLGTTADFLRLARYKNWFRDGKIWESPYETQLRDQLHTSPWVIENTDPWLRKSNRRYIILILLHHAIHAFKSSLCDGLGIYHKVIYMRWDSGMWSNVFPTGIPPLSNVHDWLSRFWSDKFQFRTFHAYLDWLGQRGRDKTGAEESECSTMNRLSVWV
ncbi:hypothetical protein N7447_001914 [Penicillium robsamsonii]|uniref:uncharacterized protein n=1 Tax=Penicillium robsamsonii TaxID=1792511 RepID=UPI002547BF14|nr:uncharacterized protein N7447_001914 [Penicillium robsamsonii]KAJ5835888.1 hypothetical protein N7447_001914 [Penicillium robsamsonii]